MNIKIDPSTPKWCQPNVLLIMMTITLVIGFNTWQALINNFSFERAAFTGVEIGTLQSLREIPGLLSFSVIYVILIISEHRLALISLFLLGVGVALTGQFSSEYGLYFTTILMSIGFHYFDTLRQSLTLQWLDKKEAPLVLGRMASVGALTALGTFGGIWILLEILHIDMVWIYVLSGLTTAGMTIVLWLAFPHYTEHHVQHKKFILRKRYSLYYALSFLWGGRRQIFVVFAGFLMVEKFGLSVSEMASMFLVSNFVTWIIAPKLGKVINKYGERKVLVFEYLGLFGVFVAYAFVGSAWLGVALYIIDHIFFSMSFATKTYFQKISDDADIAATSAVTFTINHIMAVIIPVTFGYIWVLDHAFVFLAGAAMAFASLVFAMFVPRNPKPGRETVFTKE